MDNIDFNFVQLNRTQVLQRYKSAARQLRQLAKDYYGVNSFVFDNYILLQYFQHRRNSIGGRSAAVRVDNVRSIGGAYLKLELFQHIFDRRRQILSWLFYLTLFSLCVAAYRYETGTGSAANNNRVAQSFVYPSMRIWRRITMPILQRFPRLTELYDESCLMGNPFFQLEGINCAPCAFVESVWFEDEKCHSEDHEHNGIIEKQEQIKNGIVEKCHRPANHVPIAFKSNQPPIKLNDFYDIYASNLKIFQRDAYRVHSTHNDVHNLEELFFQFNNSVPVTTNNKQNNLHKHQHTTQTPETYQQTHNLWRCNRMLPARLLRPIFARPTRLPSMSVALERYIAFDTAQAPAYSLPETECPNVYIHQAVGTRFIILRPTSECRQRCRTLSMRLPQSFVLSYNWLYWKPISAPDPISEEHSISLIGSYC